MNADPEASEKVTFEYIREQQRLVSGIDVEDATWDKLRELAGEYGLADELDLA